MRERASALVLLAGLLVGCTKPAPAPAPADAAQPEQRPADLPNVRTVPATQEWRGEVDDPAPAGVAPKSLVITTRDEFDKVWQTWWRTGKTPEVDFKTSFVAVVTWIPGQTLLPGVAPKPPPQGTDGVSITGLIVLPDGSARLVMSPHIWKDEKWSETKGFYWGMSVFPRAGITSVNDVPLPPP